MYIFYHGKKNMYLKSYSVSPAYVQHCERRQRIHLDSYQSTKVVFPQQFPVQKGYAGWVHNYNTMI